MLQRVAWLLLLAVIVSTQVFTVACDTRCGRAEVAAGMVGGRCACMQSSGRGLAVVMPAMGSMCKDLLCKDDSASITNIFTADRAEVAWALVWVRERPWAGGFGERPLDTKLRRSWLNHRTSTVAPDSLRI
jgi:hypothetical protein